jgi:DNA-binding transcriptional MocR family regulator
MYDVTTSKAPFNEANDWNGYLDYQVEQREQQRFLKAVDKYVVLRDIVSYIAPNFSAGDRLPAERMLELEVGYCRSAIREALIKLECFGYIEIQPSKAKVLLKKLPSITACRAGISKLVSGHSC